MSIDRIKNKGKYILGALLLSGMIASCTEDYFLDENNYWIYVPEIRERTVQDFYVAFHDTEGNHLRTRYFSGADFDEPYVTDGIIRSKLKAGEVNVMCFSQLNSLSVTGGQPLAKSYLSLLPVDGKSGLYRRPGADCRIFHKVRTVYPIGHPDAQLRDEIRMDENTVCTGSIMLEFKKLPEMVDRVEVFYAGLATRMNFDGTLGVFTPSDRVWASYAPLRQTTVERFSDHFLPSAGGLITPRPEETTPLDGRTPLTLEVIFYQGDQTVGRLTENNLGGDHPVTDDKGNPLSGEIFLEARQTICLHFEGFTLMSIKLTDWGGIEPGETTPV